MPIGLILLDVNCIFNSQCTLFYPKPTIISMIFLFLVVYLKVWWFISCRKFICRHFMRSLLCKKMKCHRIFVWELQKVFQTFGGCIYHLSWLLVTEQYIYLLQFDMLTENIHKVRPNRPPKPPPVLKPTSPPFEPKRTTEDIPSTSA